MKREALKNEVKIIGEIVNKTVRRNNEGKDNETISVELLVRTGETEEHTVQFFAFKHTKDKDGNRSKNNDISKLYSGYETMAKEYKFIADENGDGTGEKVEIKGKITKDYYVGKDEKPHEIQKISGKFCSRVTDMNKYKPCAVFTAHVHIMKMQEDVKDVTGEYVKITGMLVDDFTENEIEFRLYNPKVIKGFCKVYSEDDSAVFKGNIVNRPDEAEVETDDEEEGWGVEMEVEADTSTIRRRYLEILKGDPKPLDVDEDDEEHPLSKVNIKKYKKNIAKRKSDAIARYEEKQKSSGAKGNIDPNTGKSLGDVVDDLEDIPF